MKALVHRHGPAPALLAAGLVAAIAVVGWLGVDALVRGAKSDDPGAPVPTSIVTGTTATAPDKVVLPPGRIVSWLDKQGRIEMPVFDDRHVSDEIRAAYPWTNPRWAPFNRCLQAGNYGIAGPILSQAQAQQSLDSINAEGPFTARGQDGALVIVESPGLAVFSGCSYILELDQSALAPLLKPGDPTGEMPIIP